MFEAFLEKQNKKKPFGPWDQRIVLVSSSHRPYRLPDSVRQCWWWQRRGWGQAWRGRARRRPFWGGSRRRIRCTWLFSKGQFASDSQHVEVVHYSQSVLIRSFILSSINRCAYSSNSTYKNIYFNTSQENSQVCLYCTLSTSRKYWSMKESFISDLGRRLPRWSFPSRLSKFSPCVGCPTVRASSTPGCPWV